MDCAFRNDSDNVLLGFMVKRLLKLFLGGQKKPESVFNPENFTDRSHLLITQIVPSEEGEFVLRRIQQYCDTACQHFEDKYSERVVFSILKCSIRSGSFQEKDFSDALTKLDYRDLLVSAGFGDDIYLHNEWADDLLKGR